MDVADRVVLITGASSGVGAALATQLGQMGARVVANYSRSAEGAEAVVEQITGAGGQALAVQAEGGVASAARRGRNVARCCWRQRCGPSPRGSRLRSGQRLIP